MLRLLSIRTKLLLSVAIPIGTLIFVAVLAYPTLNTVKVNGPEYAKIRVAQDVRADVLPPPLFLVETHSIAADLLTREDGADFVLTSGYLKGLQTAYVIQHQVWQKGLKEKKLRQDLLVTSFAPADKYLKVLFKEYLPTLDKAWKAGYRLGAPDGSPGATEFAQARVIYRTKLADLYEQHRQAITKVVDRSEFVLDSTERSTRELVSHRIRVLGLAVGGSIALAALLGFGVARAISRPVRRLTEAATEAATTELPRAVAQIQASGDPSEVFTAKAMTIDSKDELGALAAAFNGVQSTALSLATDQARIRRVVANNLVNLGRRNQALLTRTLSFISDLEQGERDPRRLDQLFRIDHLVTRMRRNAESLLVLAGSESPQRWSSAVDVGDVVRAAVSEIEAYTRVDITNLEPALVRGSAVSDIAHLLAELTENATSFSPPASRVSVLGKRRNDGYLIVIVDDGFGMAKEELDRANRKIAQPAAFETEASNVLGLQVVGNLARRHGVTVDLTESFTSGIAARVLLPMHLLEVPNATAKRMDDHVPGAPAAWPAVSATDKGQGVAAAVPPPAAAPASSAALPSGPVWTVPPAPPAPPAAMCVPPSIPAPTGAANLSALFPLAPLREVWPGAPGATAAPRVEPPVAPSTAPVNPAVTGASWEELVGGAPVSAGAQNGPAAMSSPPPELTRRVRGAQLPDTGPPTSNSEPSNLRDPEAVKSSLERLQRGVESGRHAPEEK